MLVENPSSSAKSCSRCSVGLFTQRANDPPLWLCVNISTAFLNLGSGIVGGAIKRSVALALFNMMITPFSLDLQGHHIECSLEYYPVV